MSADLFAEFGKPGSLSHPTGGSSSSTESSNSTNHSRPSGTTSDANGNLTLIDFSSETQQLSSISQNKATHSIGTSEILFDASTEPVSNDASEDEWGEFESAEPDLVHEEIIQLTENGITAADCNLHNVTDQRRGDVTPKHSLPASLDLLSIDDTSPSPKSPLRAPLALDCGVQNKHLVKETQGNSEPVTAWPDFGDEDDWGDFAVGVEGESNRSDVSRTLQNAATFARTAQSPSVSQPVVSKLESNAQRRIVTPSPKAVRPTNIPPPAILLRLFPPLLERLRSKASGYATRSRAKAAFLPDDGLMEEITYNLKAMLHIIVGRSLRWKRDSMLSQSTKIGPASGRSGGMKLSSVNRSENVKEEKEVIEVLEIWKKCSGLLNSAITAGGRPPIQFVAGNMQVKIATAQEGALKAAHACALCGLRRDERVSKLDDDIDDIFEEWWIEHWGHSHCKRFWEASSIYLDQR
ncbi:hypothetical protein PRK78_000776 [Emydomyces testavorans]|uniref:Uncharacterized protein n=1 Tax=Emydomyces testavorans TaxID=2070801 RepID=A0AAF0IFZ2_9EURO|nr:hypothetical protein PRK78_000776 [Emydomyces testavorans]